MNTFARGAQLPANPFTVLDDEDSIDVGQMDVFYCAVGPMNFQLVYRSRIAYSIHDVFTVL